MTQNGQSLNDIFETLEVAPRDTYIYINLFRASIGCEPTALNQFARCWRDLHAAAAQKGLYDEPYAFKARQILLGVLCLRWAYAGFCDYLHHNRQYFNPDFFETFVDLDNYAAVTGARGAENLDYERLTVFMQGFYNLIADTGHIITTVHIKLLTQMFDLAQNCEDSIIQRQKVAELPRYFRGRNRNIAKKARARLLELFPACVFRIFQQDYDAGGVLACNATLYHDFSLPGYGFVLDCRLETDLVTQTADVTVVLFSRADKARFGKDFGQNGFLAPLGFVFYADTPNGPCWLRRQAVGLNAHNADKLIDALVTEIAAVLRALPV